MMVKGSGPAVVVVLELPDMPHNTSMLILIKNLTVVVLPRGRRGGGEHWQRAKGFVCVRLHDHHHGMMAWQEVTLCDHIPSSKA